MWRGVAWRKKRLARWEKEGVAGCVRIQEQFVLPNRSVRKSSQVLSALETNKVHESLQGWRHDCVGLWKTAMAGRP